MVKKIMITAFLDTLSEADLSFLSSLKARGQTLGDEVTEIKYHDCGHKDGKKCTNEVIL